MISVGFIEEVTFERRFERDKRVSHKDTCGSSILGNGNSQCNGLNMAMCLLLLGNVKGIPGEQNKQYSQRGRDAGRASYGITC